METQSIVFKWFSTTPALKAGARRAEFPFPPKGEDSAVLLASDCSYDALSDYPL